MLRVKGIAIDIVKRLVVTIAIAHVLIIVPEHVKVLVRAIVVATVLAIVMKHVKGGAKNHVVVVALILVQEVQNKNEIQKCHRKRI